MLKIYLTLLTFKEPAKIIDFAEISFAFYLENSNYIERVS